MSFSGHASAEQTKPPSAKKIVNLTNENKISADNDILREILLQPSIKDKNVCVVSITGTFRQGKSFLLNFLIRYLQLKYKTKKTMTEKWLDPADGNISGFPWKCGSDRHTTGILIWSEIYLAELESGEEVAIVLLDTQGTFENKTTKQNCAAIFAISTLISSVQIFNLKEKITQYDLEHLECFSGYGQLAQAQNSDIFGPPFQNLCFLIRDWPYKFEFEYGMSGGRDFLKKVTDSPEVVPAELKTQKDNIAALFQNISCCLLPHPGDVVAGNPSFNGRLDDIDKQFIQYVEEFVPSILAPENLVPKTVNGEKIKLADLYTFIKMYIQYFNSGSTPVLTTTYAAAAEAQLSIVLDEAVTLYKEAMDLLVGTENTLKNDVLEEHHLVQKQKVLDYFNNKKRIMGSAEMKKKYKQLLKKKLENKYIEYRRTNRVKQETVEELDKREEQFRKLEELQNRERQLLEEVVKHSEEILRLNQAHKEKMQEKDQKLREERETRHEEEWKRRVIELEANMKAKLHEAKVREMTEKTEKLERKKTNLKDHKTVLTRTVEDLTRTSEKLKEELEKEKNKSGCVIA